jgi:uncharacterized protein (DUF4415 family)
MKPGRKPKDDTRKLVSLRLPQDVIDWFRAHGGLTKVVEEMAKEAMKNG